VIKRRLSAGKSGHIVDGCKRFGSRQGHGSALRGVTGFPGSGPLCQFHHIRNRSSRS
jgi:hypothetical protein